ncbi:hypothetical protein N7535_003003 [Penicillium sp. DV-2018c]|nr:hypothetical protein N7535_003003 [Penicillium sp. DV-2018c]
MYEGLIVYTSPFAEGIPYINVLMSSEDYELPLQKRMVTIMDLADLVTRGAKVKTTTFDATMSHLHCTLEDIHDLVRCYNVRHAILERNILTCITRLLPGLDNIATLPVALSHQDLSPFNYLVDESTGQVQAVLDWDGALYLPVGSNFHFMDSLFGLMTTSGWQDAEDRQELETAFYDRALASLAAQGFVGITREQLESQKAVGMLEYGVKRLLKFQDERSEHYLDGYLRGLSFMNGCMFP